MNDQKHMIKEKTPNDSGGMDISDNDSTGSKDRKSTASETTDPDSKEIENDWHSIFYAALMIELYDYRDRVKVEREVKLGAEPPQADFLIVNEDELVDLGLGVFKIFRKHNIIEYKGEGDTLNERVLYKALGYAGLYIGLAKHEGDRPADEVTVSIFREARPDKLLSDYADRVIPDEVAGIYHMTGFSLPVQIVVMRELEGPAYRLFRSISKKASEQDFREILMKASRETEMYLREQYRIYLQKVSNANKNITKEIKGDNEMKPYWMEVFKEEIDDYALTKLYEYVIRGSMTYDSAVMESGLTADEFSERLDKYVKAHPEIMQPVQLTE